MRYFKNKEKIAYNILRIGLGLVFVLIAIDEIRKPLIWSSFIPEFIKNLWPFSIEYFIYLNAIFELAVAFTLISNILIRYGALLGALHMLGIIISLGFNEIAFRDFGLFMSFLALFFLTFRKT